ncbi:MAG: chemotaxis protein CheW [Gemmatimonadaceae bacterium]
MIAPVDAPLTTLVSTSPPLSSATDVFAADSDSAIEMEQLRSLVFRAGGRVYACDVTQVREVVPMPIVTRIPGAPSSVLGLINVRGAIITVFDAGDLLHQRPVERRDSIVLVVDYGQNGVGLAVERVADVRALRVDEGYQSLDVRRTVARVISITEEG